MSSEEDKLAEYFKKSYDGKNTLTPETLATLVKEELASQAIIKDTSSPGKKVNGRGGSRLRASSRKYKKSTKRVFRKKSRATRRR